MVIAGLQAEEREGSFCRKTRRFDKARRRGVRRRLRTAGSGWEGRLILTTSQTKAAMTTTGSSGTNSPATSAATTAATTATTGVRTTPTIATTALRRSSGRNSSQPTTRNGRNRIQSAARTSVPRTAAVPISARMHETRQEHHFHRDHLCGNRT